MYFFDPKIFYFTPAGCTFLDIRPGNPVICISFVLCLIFYETDYIWRIYSILPIFVSSEFFIFFKFSQEKYPEKNEQNADQQQQWIITVIWHQRQQQCSQVESFGRATTAAGQQRTVGFFMFFFNFILRNYFIFVFTATNRRHKLIILKIWRQVKINEKNQKPSKFPKPLLKHVNRHGIFIGPGSGF